MSETNHFQKPNVKHSGKYGTGSQPKLSKNNQVKLQTADERGRWEVMVFLGLSFFSDKILKPYQRWYSANTFDWMEGSPHYRIGNVDSLGVVNASGLRKLFSLK